MDSQES